MLHDRARIEVRAGAGGDGSAGFRREAHVPRGGPDGGDGGRGGDVVLVCDDSLRDLQSFHRKAHYRAGRGGHGEGALRHGADGDTLVVRVPPGTQVQGVEGEVVGRRWDLLADGPASRGRQGWLRREGQQALRHPHAPGAPLRRARPPGRGGLAAATAQAARRRGPRRPSQRGQVLAAGTPHAGHAQGGQLSRSRRSLRFSGSLEGRGAPACDRGHPRSDRRRERGGGARPRLPRPRGAHAVARARARHRPRAHRRGGCRPGRQLLHDRARARGARRAVGAPSASARALKGRPRARGARGRGGGAVVRAPRPRGTRARDIERHRHRDRGALGRVASPRARACLPGVKLR